MFVVNCKEKAKLFNDFFIDQYRPLLNTSSLPLLSFRTNQRLDSFEMGENDILSLIRGLDSSQTGVIPEL